MKAGIVALAGGLIASSASIGLYAAHPQKPRAVSQTSSAAGVSADQGRALLDRYCVTCHSQRTKAGSLVLESSAANLSQVGENGVLWEKVVRKLRGRLMPPVPGDEVRPRRRTKPAARTSYALGSP